MKTNNNFFHSNNKPYTLEVCVDCTESALTAAKNGATRLELCSNLVIGGTTSSLELFQEIKENSDIDMNILIRPRFGDFHYTAHEHAIMCREIAAFIKTGAHGIVIGSLNTDGTLNLPMMQEMIQAAKEAGECHITLHRAFDVCNNPLKALFQAADLGIDTILTSGQAANCLDGQELLKKLIKEAPSGMNILIGAGVTPSVISQILDKMPARHFHLSGKKILESEMIWRNEKINMGLPGISEFEIYRTDGEIIRQAKEILEQAWGLKY